MQDKSLPVRLARELGLGSALAIGIGTMIGAGIFVLPGIVASVTGPAVIIFFVLCGVVSLFIALCMSELATGMPEAGGGYLFVVRTFGGSFGSIPDKVANLSVCSVLMVRAKKKGEQ